MTTRGLRSSARSMRVAARLLAVLALVLSIAAPLHGLLHEHHEHAHGTAVHEAGHQLSHAADSCPLCTLNGNPALQHELPLVAAPEAPGLLAGPRAVVLASREGAAAPARGPPAPTC